MNNSQEEKDTITTEEKEVKATKSTKATKKAPAKKKTTKKAPSKKKEPEKEVIIEEVLEMNALEKEEKQQAEQTTENTEEIKEESKVVTEDIKENLPAKSEEPKKDIPYVFARIEDLDVDQGLSSEEAQNRIEHHYNNENNVKTTKSAWQIIRGNVFTFFNMLYLVITVLLIVAGFNDNWSNLSFLPVILLNTILGIYQEFKAKKIIEKLNLVTSPRATVIRDGERKEISTNEVVVDDAIRFTTGNQIITDSVVRKGFVEVNESMITGEPDAILKQEGDTLYSGSFVVSGSCIAQVDHVGKDNYIEKLAMEAKKQKSNKSELLNTLNWIIRIIGFIIVPLAIFLFYQGYIKLDSTLTFYERFKQVVPEVAGSVIGMIPSGLFLLTTMALSAGVYRLAKKNQTMVQQLYCIEMLARVDVLCLDKTGTITDGTMRVIDCMEIKNTTDYTLREIIGSMMNSFEDTNATSEALIRFFDVNKVLTPVKIIPFSSQRKYSAVGFEGAGTFFLGAPEFVFPEGISTLKNKINKYASQGCRVLLLTHTPTIVKTEHLPKNVKPIGMIVIQDHIRDDAFETIEYFRNNDVDIKVISGDNPVTVAEIASRAGVQNTNRYVSLEGLSEDEVKEIAFDYTVFGRVTPPQKKALVEAYKAKKKTVAMTGDGVNDILALKEADCSIAMASGSEATRNVANIVLMDSNFSAMPSVVAEGRRVINNIQRTSTLFLVKTMFTIMLTLFCICIHTPYFFQSSQLILIEFFINGFAATFISLLPNNEKVQGKFIANVLNKALPGAITVLLFNIALYVIGTKFPAFGWFNGKERTDLFTTMALIITTATCVVVLYKMCKPFNPAKIVIFAIVLLFIGLAFYFGLYQAGTPIGTFVNNFLKLDWPIHDPTLTLPNTLMVILMILLINPVMDLIERLLSKLRKIKF